ncbi:uncharacterized protein UTRI_10207 [Ustilago trichophora]|uniref:F-box domain-containing protein n=1 Tax=Ustilago trichophora TaxID=86804 RepID=A0A5C3EJE8_9BASI|nr:uncharacterized protein UTRI_10207 [Ustilago trichophora]
MVEHSKDDGDVGVDLDVTQRGLLALPTELIHTILLALPPLCIEHFSQTCKLARHHVYGNASEDSKRSNGKGNSKGKGNTHLWKQLYLQRFDDYQPLWDGPSVMSLVQLRDRAARLYAGEPSGHSVSLNFDAVLSALLSIIDTAVPLSSSSDSSSRNATWLDDSVLSSGQATWSQWVFPRSIITTLDELKRETAATDQSVIQERKRRRLSDNHRPGGTSTSAIDKRPDPIRRRSVRLLKYMYPKALHGLVDEGVDIDALSPPQVRLAARIHCLHGIRAWKDAQKQRLTESPQEIPGQRQHQDGLANEGASQASAQNAAEDSVSPDSRVQEDDNDDDASDDDDDDADDESFDDPPEAILRFRSRMFGPSFGFCSAPAEEDEVRARMRHRVYDSGYYGWSNGYAPLHAWRYRPGHVEDEGGDDDGDVDEDETDDVGSAGSEDGDNDALREAVDLSDDDEDIPDDPVPIEIEVSNEGDRRTFQVADRYGNPIEASRPVSQASDLQAASGWDSSDEEMQNTTRNNAQNGTSRSPYDPPDLGTYDANTRTYTYEGHLPMALLTGSRIQVTIGDTVDFVAIGELNVRFIRPGMLAETMRVTSGHDDTSDDPPVVEEDVEEDEDDDFDEDADDWNEHDDVDEEDDDGDNLGTLFDMFRPLAGAAGYRGCHADKEIGHLIEQRNAVEENKEEQPPQIISLCRKSIHWELVEAIMVIMYANLKEAIWLENWGVGIRIPKVYDDSGMLIRDPMEAREFLDFPTGWMSSLPSSLPPKSNSKDVAAEDASDGDKGSSMATTTSDDDKPHDWARCESFWAGTYAFLDYSHFVDFNMRMARRRREALARAETHGDGSSSNTQTSHSYLDATPDPSLVGQEEAVGDCLQLRLEVLPKSQCPAYDADEEGQEDDSDYPTLFFRGTTVTYWGNDAPMPRGGVHGKVRPVYAREEDVDEILSRGPRGKKKIEGLHWSLTHVYEGEDRWQLEGIQPGPPGTRAPIFGIWTDALHEQESPNGPFVYWMMDERPWKEIEQLNRQEAHNIVTARAAGDR